jgi:hypothetical protein
VPIDPDYVNVAERIRQFYEAYPDGRLVTVEHGLHHVGERTFVYCRAKAYREPDDPTPCIGVAWEPVPGPTSFTRDSELMNAETSAWGRAIVAVGIPSKRIASADEVQARQPEPEPAAPPTGERTPSEPEPGPPESSAEVRRKAELKRTFALVGELDKAGTIEPPDRAGTWEAWLALVATRDYGVRSRAELTADEWMEIRAKIAEVGRERESGDEPF